MCEKLKISVRKNFFSRPGIVFSKFDINKRCQNEIQDKNEKTEVDPAIKYPTKSILRPMIFI